MSQSTMTCITVLPNVVVPIQNASLSVASMTIMAEREEVIDFTKPFRPRGLTLMMKKSEIKSSFLQVQNRTIRE